MDSANLGRSYKILVMKHFNRIHTLTWLAAMSLILAGHETMAQDEIPRARMEKPKLRTARCRQLPVAAHH